MITNQVLKVHHRVSPMTSIMTRLPPLPTEFAVFQALELEETWRLPELRGQILAWVRSQPRRTGRGTCHGELTPKVFQGCLTHKS